MTTEILIAASADSASRVAATASIILTPNEPDQTSAPILDQHLDATLPASEMLAALNILRTLKGTHACPLTVYLGCSSTVDSLTLLQNSPSISRRFEGTKGKPLANAKLLELILEESEALNVSWKTHSQAPQGSRIKELKGLAREEMIEARDKQMCARLDFTIEDA